MNVSLSDAGLFVSFKTGTPVELQTAHLNSSYLNLLVKVNANVQCASEETDREENYTILALLRQKRNIQMDSKCENGFSEAK